MDINRMLRSAISTGEVRFGLKEAQRAVKAKKAKLLIVANDCPANEIKAKNLYKFKGNNMELGAVCGKPFSISVLSVLDAGSSEILSAAGKK